MTLPGASQHPPKLRLAEMILADKDIDLGEWLRDQRSRGHSLEQISRDLYVITDLKVSVTLQTIGRWLEDLEVAS